MPNVYRTARGSHLDMDRLRLMNEDTIAVGNQRVNARGDMLDSNGRVVMTKDQVMSQHYAHNKSFNIPKDQPVMEDSVQAKNMQRVKADMIDSAKLQDTIAKLQQQIQEKDALLAQQAVSQPTESVEEPAADPVEPESTETKPKLRGGLAAAIAKNKDFLESKSKGKRL